ncbi:hypothetical protein [Nocardia otitidiscaviarum]|uniref:hypothetical protein n=1 Tax=Nocardia otitidiscaviarum TaxID=1823 RepID=UPI001894D441|nr:hypothetical protein [Nocardia otitidiscaviarum]MBF6182147.1 hypothetical protein [Nocardia otitidiscaviarum]
MRTDSSPDDAILAVPAMAVGIVMLTVALATAPLLPGWADDYGTILVALAVAEYLAAATASVRWGCRALCAAR